MMKIVRRRRRRCRRMMRKLIWTMTTMMSSQRCNDGNDYDKKGNEEADDNDVFNLARGETIKIIPTMQGVR